MVQVFLYANFLCKNCKKIKSLFHSKNKIILSVSDDWKVGKKNLIDAESFFPPV